MPDHAIARIDDPNTREAVMSVRSEIFRTIEQRDKRHDAELNRLMGITNLLTQQGMQLLTRFEDFARGSLQFQESLGRILEKQDVRTSAALTKLDARMEGHENEDKRRFGSITRMFIYGLGTSVLILLGAIGFLIVHSFVLH